MLEQTYIYLVSFLWEKQIEWPIFGILLMKYKCVSPLLIVLLYASFRLYGDELYLMITVFCPESNATVSFIGWFWIYLMFRTVSFIHQHVKIVDIKRKNTKYKIISAGLCCNAINTTHVTFSCPLVDLQTQMEKPLHNTSVVIPVQFFLKLLFKSILVQGFHLDFQVIPEIYIWDSRWDWIEVYEQVLMWNICEFKSFKFLNCPTLDWQFSHCLGEPMKIWIFSI